MLSLLNKQSKSLMTQRLLIQVNRFLAIDSHDKTEVFPFNPILRHLLYPLIMAIIELAKISGLLGGTNIPFILD